MPIDKGLEKIGDLFNKPGAKPAGARKPAPAYAWQDLALSVIEQLNIPGFKRSAVFKVCKQKSRSYIEKCLNDTKELCLTGEQWKYFFKVVGGSGKENYKRKFMVR
jgi:hypothetical protein